jgi:hypothetical protein
MLLHLRTGFSFGEMTMEGDGSSVGTTVYVSVAELPRTFCRRPGNQGVIVLFQPFIEELTRHGHGNLIILDLHRFDRFEPGLEALRVDLRLDM